jgi:protein ImuB
LPVPSPALVPSRPTSAAVLDVVGNVVHCSERGELSSPPATVAVGDRSPHRVLASAGPWIVHPAPPGQRGRPLVRLQVVLQDDDEDSALLLAAAVGTDPRWTVQGDYD